MTPQEWRELGLLGRFNAYLTLERERDHLRELLDQSFRAREACTEMNSRLLDRLEGKRP